MSTKFQMEVAGRTLSIESGLLAQQAGGSVVVRHGDTVVLVTATMGGVREGLDFFPLTIEYEERLYAVGRIPGSFFRREGRPTTEATLAARLTDRPLRPRFPKGMRNEVQVVATVLSVDHVNQPDILTIIGASAALSISDIPFNGPVGATRVGYVDGEYIVNPTYEQLSQSKLDLTIAGSRDAVIMIEAGAKGVPEEIVLEALRIGQENNVKVIELQDKLVAEAGRPKTEVRTADGAAPELVAKVEAIAKDRIGAIIDHGEGRGERNTGIKDIERDAIAQLGEQFGPGDVAKVFDDVLKKVTRAKILYEQKRPDGRALTEVRPLSSMVGLLPRTHGSALFQRGETQILTVATLGSLTLEQKLDGLSPEDTKRYIHHYNFPPYSTGEVRRIGTGRREIGHGALAERALAPVIPDESEFPYALRLVSEALSSNGSTSLGSVCGSTLSLMDAV
ncbi:MAG: polyribonucleotide nucleotidyltransferase, partial [Dehalococcoidia bacterium]